VDRVYLERRRARPQGLFALGQVQRAREAGQTALKAAADKRLAAEGGADEGAASRAHLLDLLL